MDEAQAGGAELREAYRHLRRLNRIFGAASPILYGIERLWKAAGKPKRMKILDIGAGSGDVNRSVLRWAERYQIDLHIVLIDISPEACEEAKLLYNDEPRVEVRRCDLYALQVECADIVTASQFLHHIRAADISKVAARMADLSRFGVVINDIHRHPVAWAAVWFTTRVISHNRYIRHDGPLSVAKGFRAQDWRQLEIALPMHELSYSWRPLFRYAVIIGKSSSRADRSEDR